MLATSESKSSASLVTAIVASLEARDAKRERFKEAGDKWRGRMPVQSRGVQEFGQWRPFIARIGVVFH
jgi:hypothetical protein